MFAHANEYRTVSQAMMGKQSGAAVQRVLYKLLVDLVRDDVKAAVPQADRHAIPREALVHFIAGAFSLPVRCLDLLMWWLEERKPLSVKAMNELFRRLAIPAVTAARG
ncbi:MAG TPA: TetR-like C-terminal domain-containing protein [Vicinamibacterales bacterium]|jgi:hypothetical protein|nr:TetR-like C-terminal domain-containing protein [Vicinamibacterales bacterium]